MADTNRGVLGAIVVLAFGCRFMVLIFIFNINYLQPLPYPCFCIIAYIVFQFNLVGWCFLVVAIAYFCSHWTQGAESVCVVSRSLALATPILLFRCDSHCQRIGSLELSMIYMLYVKPKVQLSWTIDYDYLLELGCDYAAKFISQM